VFATGAAPSPSSGTRQKSCWRCGETFACGPCGAGEDCWCNAHPRAPIVSPEADCLCPACLTAAIGQDAGQRLIPSPCTNVCRIAPETGLCLGCLRTLDEIARWSVLSNGERQAVFDALPARNQRSNAT
jgi:predicted Fe-S protein YdhL (DUF1289 family)